jgi:nitrogen regulatory protein P-II 1
VKDVGDIMIKIEAIIKPFKLDEVKEALINLGVHGMTVTRETKGFGRQKGHVEIFQGAEIDISFIPKVKVELVVAEDILEKVLAVIQEKTKSGKIGDGKIFVTKLADIVRVRTGEHGSAAI